MRSFLEQSAESLWQRYGEGISDLKLVFPSKRARLFFGEALSKLINRPLWQPQYLSIDDMVWGLSRMRETENLRLVAELYRIYSRYHNESFDRFYNWGVMLLQDFDMIDKYRVDADKLFANISDLKEIEAQFEDQSPERELILQFWRNFDKGRFQSKEQQEFLRIWRSLAPIYTQFRERIGELGVAYAGMAYRYVAENIEEIYTESATYCFLGFNALNECEQKIFSFLHKRGDALFLWDYSTLYVDDKSQEAGRFIRRNLARFPQAFEISCDYNRALEVDVVDSPTDILQCKALTTKLEQIYERQGYLDKETAVVLTNENMLEQVLASLPPCVERVNVTMGYPLTSTLIYNFLERLLQLQTRKRVDEFYHRDVLGILNHPYVNQIDRGEVEALVQRVQDMQRVYIGAGELSRFEKLFTPVTEVEQLQNYLLSAVSFISDTDDDQRREFTYTLIAGIATLKQTIRSCSIGLSVGMYILLLRQMLSLKRVPYTGEPLGGLQIMGILETRNIDFSNVIMLSLNDDNFPGNITSNSYIPYNLRQAYNLPTATDAEAMYAYYFYRLLQRADRLTMMYTSAADEKSTGEQSRYIYQLEYESPFKVKRSEIALSLDKPVKNEIAIVKSREIIQKMREKRYSPSALNRYLACSLRFCLYDIDYIRVDQSVEEEFSKMALGNALHRSMELLYEPFVGKVNPGKYIAAITQQQVDEVVDRVLQEQGVAEGGHFEIAVQTIKRYIAQNLAYDLSREQGFVVERLESKISAELCGLTLYGTADRVDRLVDGSLMIIDYKSGAGDSADFASVEKLFDGQQGNKAVFQTLLYALICRRSERVDVVPALYIGRLMNKEKYSPFLNMNGRELNYSDEEILKEFEERLEVLVEQMFDLDRKFMKCDNERTCAWCDYRVLCGR